MKQHKKNKSQMRHKCVKRFLYGLMNEVEEQLFLKRLKHDPILRRLAASEALLSKNYAIQQRLNKQILDEFKKS